MLRTRTTTLAAAEAGPFTELRREVGERERGLTCRVHDRSELDDLGIVGVLGDR